MGFGICECCGGYWCSVGGFVNYCICKHGGSPQEVAYAKGWQKWNGALAQLAEQGTFNPEVVGSIPTRPTKETE